MKALITGASSGIGRDMARILSSQGYELILVARSAGQLAILQQELKTASEIYPCDLSDPDACRALYANFKDQRIDLLVNNAGFGIFGEFADTDLDAELKMIDLNIKAVHILTKLFLKDFIAADQGMILNVASNAAFLPGPLLAAYYASKAYVLRLSEAIYEELRQRNSKVSISVLCPGPVKTNFNRSAGVNDGFPGMDSAAVAAYALKMLKRRKMIIVPGLMIRIGRLGNRLFSDKMLMRMVYKIQTLKRPLHSK